MKFDFDEPTDRRGSGSYKWDSSEDREILPLWVADMDFRTAPAVRKAVMDRASTGIFGYVKVPGAYYDALTGWFERRHGWKINPDRVIYTSGVVPAISAIIKALVAPGEGVIIQTPAYNCFFSSVRNNHTAMLDNQLVRVDQGSGFTYRMDFEELENIASRPEAKMLILCNPHNPTGRVWTREELAKVRDICRRHGVVVVSDEIHCELTRGGREYVPYATVDDHAIVCCSPSKAFNIAGLQIANIMCPDEAAQTRIDRAINDNEVCDVNPFGVVALQAAYKEGCEWLGALNDYLDGNFSMLRRRFADRLPQLKVCDSEATYLAWIDITPLDMSSDEVEDFLKREAKVWISSGTMYHGDGYIRINYALQRERLRFALDRIIESIIKLQRKN